MRKTVNVGSVPATLAAELKALVPNIKGVLVDELAVVLGGLDEKITHTDAASHKECASLLAIARRKFDEVRGSFVRQGDGEGQVFVINSFLGYCERGLRA